MFLISGVIPPLDDDWNSSPDDEGAVSSSQEYVDPLESTARSADLDQEDHENNPEEGDPSFVAVVRQVEEDNTANQENFVNERNPRKRPRTTAEKQHTQRQKHPLLTPCADNCRRRCTTQFTEEVRGKIHEEFWNMHYATQKQWLLYRIRKQPIQRKIPTTSARTGKSCYLYTFLSSLRE